VAKTDIEWSEYVWNPVRGCTKISPGCKHCYAETFAERFRGVKGHAYEQGFDVRLVPEALDLPLRWKKPRRVFVNSMSDLFHEQVPSTFIAKVFATMAQAPQHTFQVLTKRVERMRAWMADSVISMHAACIPGHLYLPNRGATWPLPNVWLGVSCEDQATVDTRIPRLLTTPAAVRFVSCEPLLGPVDLTRIDYGVKGFCDNGRDTRLDWIIVGGESGPKARSCNVAWVRSILAQCKAARIPAFCKQLGAYVEDRNDTGFDGDTPTSWPMGTGVEHDVGDTDYQGAPVRIRLRDRKGGDPAEWPENLRVREMPARSTNVAQDRRRNRQ
jgi:protein gp37